MSNGTNELRSLLKDVELNGVVVITQKKLLWLLGWGQNREGAWKDLLNHWVDMGHKRDTLYGIGIWDKIVLTMPPADEVFGLVLAWAGEQE